jgi:hypothetical protein
MEWLASVQYHTAAAGPLQYLVSKGGTAMALQANVAFFMDKFIATLSDGQRIERADVREMASALYLAGVHADGIEYQWHAGQRMITAGQKVALTAGIRQQQRQSVRLHAAA